MAMIPLFWQNEVSGRLKYIVKRFFDNAPLAPNDLFHLKSYMIQFIDGMPAKPPNYKQRIQAMDQQAIMRYIAGELLDYGIDPF